MAKSVCSEVAKMWLLESGKASIKHFQSHHRARGRVKDIRRVREVSTGGTFTGSVCGNMTAECKLQLERVAVQF